MNVLNSLCWSDRVDLRVQSAYSKVIFFDANLSLLIIFLEKI